MNNQDRERYLRQIAIEEVGEGGQKRLQQSSALIVGVGGLGSPIATLLTGAGFGRIGIIDFDVVSLSNLPRQTLYTTEDLGLSKVKCAKRRLKAANPNVEVEAYNLRLDELSAKELIAQYDMVIDGCDNMPTRYAIDRAARQLGKPYIYGAIRGFEGQVSIFHYKKAAAYSDLFAEKDADKIQAPPAVMATTPTIIGAIQANEAIKIALGLEGTLDSKLLTLDTRGYTLNIFDI